MFFNVRMVLTRVDEMNRYTLVAGVVDTHLLHFRYGRSVCIAVVMGAKGVVSRTRSGYHFCSRGFGLAKHHVVVFPQPDHPSISIERVYCTILIDKVVQLRVEVCSLYTFLVRCGSCT
jgi:hypothetical protein